MILSRLKFKLWMLEIPVWIVGLLWVMSAGADSFPSERGLNRSLQSSQSQLVQDPLGGAARARMQAAYGRLPLGFESNQGQADSSIHFLSRSTSTGLFFKRNELVLQLGVSSHSPLKVANSKEVTPQAKTRIRLRWLGANTDPEILGEERLGRKSHYLAGDANSWRLNVPNYSRIRYKGIYPGIDLIFYGNPELLEYDFVLSPGADPATIALRFDGLQTTTEKPLLWVDENGDLLLPTKAGVIRQHKPLAFQQTKDGRITVSTRYVIFKDGMTVGFEMGPYDPGRPLVIDPVLSYSVTGIGGSAIAVDAQGQAYVAGVANPAFVPAAGAFQASPGGGTCVSGPNTIPCPDILIAKLNSSGTDLVYSTFLGGSGSDYAYGIAVDPSGNVYVTGATSSTNFPVTANALNPAHSRSVCGSISATAPCSNAFVTKLNATGTALAYSTYLNGANGGIGGNAIAVDALGQTHVTGDRPSGGFVTKLNSTGSATIYSAAAVGGAAIALDSTGSAYTTGRKGLDSFISKLSLEGAVLYSFRLGGTFTTFSAPPEEVEALTGVAVDGAGNAYVTGYTAYKDFPTTPDAVFPTPPGLGICGNSLCRDAFISKLNVTGTALVYSTFLGGDSIDYGTGIAVDSVGNAYVSGVTRSTNFPSVPVGSAATSGGAFVAKLNPSGSALIFATTLGSSQTTEGSSAVALDASGSVFVTGTAGLSFPTTIGAFQPQVSASNGNFVAKFFDDLLLFVPVILSSGGQNNSFFTSELTLTNRSTREVVLEYTYTAAFGGGSGRATDSLPAGRQRVVPDAISYLRSLGLPIPETGNRGGTLGVRFSGLTSPTEGAVTVRTATPVDQGRVGLAYQGIPRGLTGPSYLSGLRHDAIDRSNLAIQNSGDTSEGSITLRLTVFSGEPSFPTVSRTLPDEVLAPGGFRQLTGILQAAGGLALTNGYVRVERVAGVAPYYAYAVINDQASSDGSFIAPVLEGASAPRGLTIPVIVETASFSSDLALTNGSSIAKVVRMTLVADGIQAPDSTATVNVTLRSQEQLLLPNLVQWMRQRGAAGLEPATQPYMGALFLTVPDGDMSGIYAAARTSTRGEGASRYGVSYAAIPNGASALPSVWIHGLQQNAENRSNLGLLNTGETDGSSSTFRLELYDGESGQKVVTVEGVQVPAKRLLQIGSIFEKYAPATRQGYLRISRITGANPFIAYSVINDGASPGLRSGDGAYLSGSP